MNRTKKTIALLLTGVFALTGCTKEEQKLISALDKLSEAKYYEQQSHISFELNYSGGDEYFREEMEKMKYIVDALAIDSSAVFEGSVKDNSFKSHINAKIELDPVTLSGDMWLDADMGSDNPKYETIAKIPALAKSFMDEINEEDYLYIERVKYIDALMNGASIRYSSLSGLSSISQIFNIPVNLQQRKYGLVDMIKASKSLSGNCTISSNTESGVEVLTLKMSDKQLKAFILSTLSEMRTNDDMLDIFVQTLVQSIPPIWDYMYVVESESGETKRKLVDSFDETLLELEEYFDSNSILGGGGLSYEIMIDESGYITGEVISANILLSEELYDFVPYYFRTYIPFYLDEDSGTLELTVNVKTENTGFNADNAVKFPKLTKGNTYDFMSAIEEEIERSAYNFPYISYMFDGLPDVGETPVDFPIVGSFDGRELNSIVSLINAGEYGGTFYIPLRQAAELFGGEIEWNADKKTAFWKRDNLLWIVPANYDEFYEWYFTESGVEFENGQYILDAGCLVNGMAFVKLEALEYFLYADFGFDDNTNTLLIR